MTGKDTGIRLYLETPLTLGAHVALGESQAHYLRNVMRLGTDDFLLAFDGENGEFQCRVVELGKKLGVLHVDRQTRPQSDEGDLWLVFAPIKKTPIDFIGAKATELGIAALQPVITKRTVVGRVNETRLCANAIEAAEQCGRLTVPTVHPVTTFEKLMSAWPEERRILLCAESGDAEPMADAISAIVRNAEADLPWAIFIGPEGGYAPEELETLRKNPIVTSVSLGERLLRADTAALASIACWQAIAGDWRRPRSR